MSFVYIFIMLFFLYAIQTHFSCQEQQISCVIRGSLRIVYKCMASVDLPSTNIFLIFDTND